jgi:solute carrier family 41
MWKWKIDPDNATIPYLTSLGDLLGSSLLALAFLFLQNIGHPYGGDRQELIGPTVIDAGFTTMEPFTMGPN